MGILVDESKVIPVRSHVGHYGMEARTARCPFVSFGRRIGPACGTRLECRVLELLLLCHLLLVVL